VRPDELERRLRARLDALGLAPRAELTPPDASSQTSLDRAKGFREEATSLRTRCWAPGGYGAGRIAGRCRSARGKGADLRQLPSTPPALGVRGRQDKKGRSTAGGYWPPPAARQSSRIPCQRPSRRGQRPDGLRSPEVDRLLRPGPSVRDLTPGQRPPDSGRMRPDELDRRLRERLNALGPAPRAELLHVLRLSDFDRADAISARSGATRRRGPSPSC
jgi:hypothetical protein